jgi:segregation and condensation protein B
MDYFGINSPDDLPKLKEVFADNLIPPTINNSRVEQADKTQNLLVVSESGELIENNEEKDKPETTLE